MLRLTHQDTWREQRREAIEEARARKALRGEKGGEGGDDSDAVKAARAAKAVKAAERGEKERRRDRAVQAVLGGRHVYGMLGMPRTATEAELLRAMRLAMRLLHPDLAINQELRGTPEGQRIEAAFKRVNNLKDMRIEQWFTGEAMKT